MKSISIMLLVFLLLTPAWAEWKPNAADELQVQAGEALDRFRAEEADTLQPFFDKAYGYAVFPKMRQGALLFGYGSGIGVVIEGGKFVGYSRQRRFSLGAQLGMQVEAQIFFFRDLESLIEFKKGTLEFTPQASATAGGAGGSTDAGFNRQVAIFSLTEKGLMLEASAGASKFKFKPAQ